MEEVNFKSADEIPIIEEEIIERYYLIKKELSKLEKEEDNLKEIIKKKMSNANLKNIITDKMDLFYNEIERISYPKEMIEKFVSTEIKDQIRLKNKIVVFVGKIKK